jgi:hypothetical protein
MGYIGLFFAACLLIFVKEPIRRIELKTKESELVQE